MSGSDNSFWFRKMEFYYNEVLDVNNDGVVNEADLETFKAIFKQMKHLSGDSPALQQFTSFLNKWFKAIMPSDGDNNKSITLKEFIPYCAHIREELHGRKTIPDSLSYIKDYISALFHLLDADGDGYISKRDYIIAYSDFEEPEYREHYWKQICPYDTDNAKIDESSFVELCIEFLCSSNPSDRGNWIFGVFE